MGGSQHAAPNFDNIFLLLLFFLSFFIAAGDARFVRPSTSVPTISRGVKKSPLSPLQRSQGGPPKTVKYLQRSMHSCTPVTVLELLNTLVSQVFVVPHPVPFPQVGSLPPLSPPPSSISTSFPLLRLFSEAASASSRLPLALSLLLLLPFSCSCSVCGSDSGVSFSPLLYPPRLDPKVTTSIYQTGAERKWLLAVLPITKKGGKGKARKETLFKAG